MKKFLLSFVALMLSVAASMAAHWTPPTDGYQSSSPVYIQLFINGQTTSEAVEIAAFIGDECRGIASAARATKTGVYLRTLNVKGNDEDLNKTITFKAYYGNREYTFTRTATFTGETTQPIPFDLELITANTITALSLPKSFIIDLEDEIDLLPELSITYLNEEKQEVTKKATELGSIPEITWTSLDATTVSMTGSVAKGVKASTYNGITVTAQIASLSDVDAAETTIRVTPMVTTLISAEFSDDLVVEKGSTLNLLDYLVLNFAKSIDGEGNITTEAKNYNDLTTAEKAKIELSTKYVDEYFTVNTTSWVLTGKKSTPFGDGITFDIFVTYNGDQDAIAQGEVFVTPYEYQITAVTIESPIVVEKGATVELLDKLTFTVIAGYTDAGAQITAQKTADEIALPEITWSINEDYATVTDNVLTAKKSTDIDGVNLTISVAQVVCNITGNATVLITPYAYTVTDISIESPLTLTVDPDTDKEHPTSMNLLDKVTFTVITGKDETGTAITAQKKASEFAAPEIEWSIDKEYALINNNVITARKRTSSEGIVLTGEIKERKISQTATVIITPDYVAISEVAITVDGSIQVYRNYDNNPQLEVQISPADAAFDPDVLTFTGGVITVDDTDLQALNFAYTTNSRMSTDGKSKYYIYDIEPSVLNNVPDGKSISWSYNDPETSKSFSSSFTVRIGQAYPLASGWNWSSLYYGNFSTPDELSDQIVDMRSQTEVGYNDDVFGWIGTLENVENDAYKIKVASATTVLAEQAMRNFATSQSLSAGWNWVYNPYQFDYPTADFVADYMSLSAQKGDKIVTLADGSLEYDGSKWVGTLASFEAGQFFMVKRAAAGIISWGAEAVPADFGTAKPAAIRSEAWSYDAHAYRDVMTLVGTVEGEDVITVGAFVDGECRGEGTIVENDGQRYFFVNVHGNVDETVTFQAFDGEEYYPLQTSVSFTADLGSLAQPIALGSVPGANGIQAIDAEAAGAELYDINGRRCATTQAGGIYIVRHNGVASKVIK